MQMWTPKKIRELRARYGETQEVFARRLAVATPTLRKWEQGVGEPLGPARLMLSRLEEDIDAGKIRELVPA